MIFSRSILVDMLLVGMAVSWVIGLYALMVLIVTEVMV